MARLEVKEVDHLQGVLSCFPRRNHTSTKAAFELPCWCIEVQEKSQMTFPVCCNASDRSSQHHRTANENDVSVLSFCLAQHQHPLPFWVSLQSSMCVGNCWLGKLSHAPLINLLIHQLVWCASMNHCKSVQQPTGVTKCP